MSGEALAAAAHTLEGTRFRLNGRDPATGLDCLGVLACALAAIGRKAELPVGYGLRCRGDMGAARIAETAGLVPADGLIAPGDVLLVRCSPVQLHLLVALTSARFVHAHAGLRRVVIGAREAAWPLAGHWRLPVTS
jgi:hypothetical protein